MDYNEIARRISESDKVIITAHKNLDFDALGSMLGIYYISLSLNKESYIIIDDAFLSHEIDRSISNVKEKENIEIRTYNEIKGLITDKSLLIICDVNKVNRLQNPKLYDIKNKIVIDHHKGGIDNLDNLSYSYINSDASSAIEIVLYLIDNLNIYIPSYVAIIMLVGIYVDTYGFLKKTTDKTHYYTSLLYKFGIDLKEAQKFLKQDFISYKRRKKLVLNTKFYDKFAITYSDEIYDSVDLAKVSDELLIFDGVGAAFTVARISDDLVGISARSLGYIDVEEIMRKFGGGGHSNEAATQIKGEVKEITNKLLAILKEV